MTLFINAFFRELREQSPVIDQGIKYFQNF